MLKNKLKFTPYETDGPWGCLHHGDELLAKDIKKECAEFLIKIETQKNELLEMCLSCAEDLAFSKENCDKELRQQLLSVIAKSEAEIGGKGNG